MNEGRTVFSQLMDFLLLDRFRACVERYSGGYKVQSFTCLDSFLCLAFAQLTFRENLRNIEACLRAQQPKLYHMGFRGPVSRSNLAYASGHRDWRIFAEFAQVLIGIAHDLIRAFYGTSENAVKTQVWVALAVYVLVAIVKKQLGLEQSLRQLLQILDATIFEKNPILEGSSNFSAASSAEEIGIQLRLFDLR